MRGRRFGPNPVCYAGRFLFVTGMVALWMLVAIAAALVEQP